jgi:hypothetical protein
LPTNPRGGLALVAARGGALRRLRIMHGDLLYVAGPATLPTSLDCVGRGRNGLVSWTQGVFGPHASFLVERRYRIAELRLRIVASSTRQVTRSRVAALAHSFFNHCGR